jgi:hypothetical protein
MTSASIVQGSLAAVAAQGNGSIAQTFINCDTIIIIDTSGSMEIVDPGCTSSRYDRACSELAKLQKSLPGKIGVINFSSVAIFCPGGRPELLAGGTNLARALKFVHVADNCGISFIVISDGQPDSEHEAMQEARTFKSAISCIHIGQEGGEGSRFLRDLAAASGGKFGAHAAAQDLANGIQRLLTAGA